VSSSASRIKPKGRVTVSVFTMSVVDSELEPQSGQTKDYNMSVVDSEFEPQFGQTRDYKMGICCFFSSIKQ